MQEIIQKIEASGATKVKIAITDIDGTLRGKIVSLDKFKSVLEAGFGFCDVVLGWDTNDAAYDNVQFTGWHTGYPDAAAVVDPRTQRSVPWENNLPFFLADFDVDGSEAAKVCSRTLLKKMIARAGSMGYHPVFAQEFEWYNFKKQPTGHGLPPVPLTEGMFGYSLLRSSQQSAYFNALFDDMQGYGVPLEGLHTETGPGVYEAAITYSDALEAADRAVLFKSGTKEIASRFDIIPSFMAKWDASLPGCSGHVHQSLWDKSKQQNLFYAKEDAQNMSDLMKSYVAGQLVCLPYILPMFAPTINSYKRLVEGAWAPTTLTWAMDNRTTALRILSEGKTSCRLESRVVGSDSNPYLAIAACLASGLYGIKKGLKLEQPPTTGNGYEDLRFGKLPSNLWEATQAMKTGSLAYELFGEAFVQHFCHTREWEWRQHAKAVTDWELKRYFEII